MHVLAHHHHWVSPCVPNQSPGVKGSSPEEQATAEEEISGEEKTEWRDSSKDEVSEDKPEQMEETAAREQRESLDTGKLGSVLSVNHIVGIHVRLTGSL